MAANFLMYTWLSFDSVTNESQWKADTPESVKKTVEGCILWLTRNTLQGRFKPWNGFFCMKNKGQDDPFRYPANFFLELMQPTSINLRTTLQLAVGMRGYVPKTEYEAMINAKQFGKPIPRIFKGFNDPEFSNMMFWSSEPLTYSVTLLALSIIEKLRIRNRISVLIVIINIFFKVLKLSYFLFICIPGKGVKSHQVK
jgi:hypothetical protein